MQALTQEATKHNILLTGYNVPDGIGDFRNLIDYFILAEEFCHENLTDSFRVRAIALVDEDKLKLANIVLPESLRGRVHFCDCDKSSYEHAKVQAASIVVLTTPLDRLKSFTAKSAAKIDSFFTAAPAIKAMFTQANCAINIATSPRMSHNVFLKNLNPSCFTHSILEYGPALVMDMNPLLTTRFYSEVSMGFDPREAGIKINDTLREMSLSDPVANIATLGNAFIKDLVSGEHTDIHCGYLQNSGYTIKFLKFVAANNPESTRVINIIGNTDHLKDLSELADINKFNTQIKTINILKNNGTLLNNMETDSIGELVINFIDFKGLSNHDIRVLMACSKIAGGSGDNSCSDVISAGAVPFIGVLPHKRDMMRNLIEFVVAQADIPDKKELIQYLQYFIKINSRTRAVDVPIDELTAFTKENLPKVTRAWQATCNILCKSHRAQTHFSETMQVYCQSRVLEKPILESSELKSIVACQARVNPLLLDNSLLTLALLKNNLPACHALLEVETQSLAVACQDTQPLSMIFKTCSEPVIISILNHPKCNKFFFREPKGESLLKDAVENRFSSELVTLLLKKGYTPISIPTADTNALLAKHYSDIKGSYRRKGASFSFGAVAEVAKPAASSARPSRSGPILNAFSRQRNSSTSSSDAAILEVKPEEDAAPAHDTALEDSSAEPSAKSGEDRSVTRRHNRKGY